ncbi:unnamed protein product [Prorocentrum cordatum]|uniref:Uncharacterized protein n=1 Tax=Prorocentrum cordatum TaxID=2364126 RepID=A0ABN9Q1N7_9DINO|nr:unnamed protein product [Polarella glacialis]
MGMLEEKGAGGAAVADFTPPSALCLAAPLRQLFQLFRRCPPPPGQAGPPAGGHLAADVLPTLSPSQFFRSLTHRGRVHAGMLTSASARRVGLAPRVQAAQPGRPE